MTYEEVKKIRNNGEIEHANIRELQKLIDVAIEKQIRRSLALRAMDIGEGN